MSHGVLLGDRRAAQPVGLGALWAAPARLCQNPRVCRGWEQGWRAQSALSHRPGLQEGQKRARLGDKGDEELDLEAQWRDSL